MTLAVSPGRPKPCHCQRRHDAVARTLALMKKRGLVGPRTSRSRGPPAGFCRLPAFRRVHDNRVRRTETARCNDPLTRIGQHRSARPATMTACAATPPGPRAASPVAPRRAARSAAPEVPSIEEPPVHDARLAPAIMALAGCYPQVVTNLWIALGALFTSDQRSGLTTRPRRRRGLYCG